MKKSASQCLKNICTKTNPRCLKIGVQTKVKLYTSSFIHICLFPGCDVLPVLPVCSSSGPAERNQSGSGHTGRLEEIQIKERSAALHGWFRVRYNYKVMGFHFFRSVLFHLFLQIQLSQCVKHFGHLCLDGVT